MKKHSCIIFTLQRRVAQWRVVKDPNLSPTMNTIPMMHSFSKILIVVGEPWTNGCHDIFTLIICLQRVKRANILFNFTMINYWVNYSYRGKFTVTHFLQTIIIITIFGTFQSCFFYFRWLNPLDTGKFWNKIHIVIHIQ